MKNEPAQKIIQQFIKNTTADGFLIADKNGERLYTSSLFFNSKVLDEVGILTTVTDSMCSRINEKIDAKGKELTVIVNKSDYVIIKEIKGPFILLAKIKRKVDINLIYNQINKLAEGLSKI